MNVTYPNLPVVARLKNVACLTAHSGVWIAGPYLDSVVLECQHEKVAF